MANPFRSPKLLAAGVLALALAAAAGAAWYHTTRPDYLLRRGRQALDRDDVAGAVRQADRLAAAGHADHAHLLRGETFYRLRRWGDAVEEFNRIAGEGPLRLDGAGLYGQCRLHLNDPREAFRAFTYVLEHRPDDLAAHRGLANLYYNQGAMVPALAEFEKVAALDDADGAPHRFMGHIYKDVERPAEAVREFEAALARRLDPEGARRARAELAELLVKGAEYARAAAVLDGCDLEEAARPALVALRAEGLWGAGRQAEARALLGPALAAHPDAVPLLAARARIHLEEGEPAAAAGLLERATAAEPHEYAHRYQLAVAYEALGRTADAAEQRRLTRKLQDTLTEMSKLTQEAMTRPWDGAVRLRLAEVCRQLGKPDVAAIWQRAAAACPPPPAAPG